MMRILVAILFSGCTAYYSGGTIPLSGVKRSPPLRETIREPLARNFQPTARADVVATAEPVQPYVRDTSIVVGELWLDHDATLLSTTCIGFSDTNGCTAFLVQRATGEIPALPEDELTGPGLRKILRELRTR